MDAPRTEPNWARGIAEDLKDTLYAVKDEIIDACGPNNKNSSANGRGPQNTRMMKIQRYVVKSYIEIECHRHISTTTEADCYHVWNRPENQAEWNERALRTDYRRGYPSPKSLRNGVLYWYVNHKNGEFE